MVGNKHYRNEERMEKLGANTMEKDKQFRKSGWKQRS
jgi:hypothetical protein